ncbi:MAG: hypothetical protein V7K21_06375, partial [Nostoc sp.]
NESLILVDPPLILVNESLILVDPPLILVNESLILVDPPLIFVNESLILVHLQTMGAIANYSQLTDNQPKVHPSIMLPEP